MGVTTWIWVSPAKRILLWQLETSPLAGLTELTEGVEDILATFFKIPLPPPLASYQVIDWGGAVSPYWFIRVLYVVGLAGWGGAIETIEWNTTGVCTIGVVDIVRAGLGLLVAAVIFRESFGRVTGVVRILYKNCSKMKLVWISSNTCRAHFVNDKWESKVCRFHRLRKYWTLHGTREDSRSSYKSSNEVSQQQCLLHTCPHGFWRWDLSIKLLLLVEGAMRPENKNSCVYI